MVLEALFDYDHAAPFDIRAAGQLGEQGVLRRNFTYAGCTGQRRAAFLVRPEQGAGPFAAILYVHWYEPESPDSNRTQFVAEAQRMAERGAVALLIETMWSDRDWFIKRTQADDERNSIEQTVELRRALDLLLSQPGVDVRRCAYVGHDFGAMLRFRDAAKVGRTKYELLALRAPRAWGLYLLRASDLQGACQRDAAYRRALPRWARHP